MKPCFKCGAVKPLADFYRHSKMADGHLGKCKECTKADVQRWYDATREQRAEYERKRCRTPERRLNALRYQTQARARHPAKVAAWNAVARAVRAGRLVRKPCEVCESTERVEAHHHDYSKPLDVQWLCFFCHRTHGHGEQPIRKAG